LYVKRKSFLLALLALAGCGSQPADSNTGSSAIVHTSGPVSSNTVPDGTAAVTNGRLTVSMRGKCRSKVSGGVLYPSVKGFTPSGTFTVNAWYPDGSPYRYLHHQGRVGSDGTLRKFADPAVRWGWACGDGANGKPDPAGRYTIQFKDNKTGQSTPAYGHPGAIHFRVYPAK
jgi:hypothetical protein